MKPPVPEEPAMPRVHLSPPARSSAPLQPSPPASCCLSCFAAVEAGEGELWAERKPLGKRKGRQDLRGSWCHQHCHTPGDCQVCNGHLIINFKLAFSNQPCRMTTRGICDCSSDYRKSLAYPFRFTSS